jgi:hypothetical protein
MVPRSAGIGAGNLKREAFMKIVTLITKRGHHRDELDKLHRTALESLTKPRGIPHQAHNYSELRQQIHDDLRIQHPEWVQPNGECPLCDAYEARLMQLLDPIRSKTDNDSVGARDPDFEHGLN